MLAGRGSHYGSNNGANALSYTMYQDIRDKNQVFQGMFCRNVTSFSLSHEGRTELVQGAFLAPEGFADD